MLFSSLALFFLIPPIFQHFQHLPFQDGCSIAHPFRAPDIHLEGGGSTPPSYKSIAVTTASSITSLPIGKAGRDNSDHSR